MKTLTDIGNGIISFINDIAVPVLFAVAMLFFLYGVVRYFINPSDENKRTEGRNYIVGAIIGFAVMISLWGLVRVLVGTFGFDNATRPCLPTFSGSGNCASEQKLNGPPVSRDIFNNGGTLPQDVLDQAVREEQQSTPSPTPTPANRPTPSPTPGIESMN